MTATRGDDALTQVLRKTILALVRRDEADLTSRQFGVFLTVYLTAGPHTVRGLAAELNVSKPAITRALDRLGEQRWLGFPLQRFGPDRWLSRRLIGTSCRGRGLVQGGRSPTGAGPRPR